MVGALRDEHQQTDDYDDFFDRVGLLYYPEVVRLDLPFDDFASVFLAEKLPVIQHFCADNSQYHIITVTAPGRYANCCVQGCRQYLLGDGDNDPALVLFVFSRMASYRKAAGPATKKTHDQQMSVVLRGTQYHLH